MKKNYRSTKSFRSKIKHYDTHTLYITSGVARNDQVYECIKKGVKEGEETLYRELLIDCFNKNGIEFNRELTNGELKNVLKDRGLEVPRKKSLKCRITPNVIVDKNGNYFGFGYIHVSKKEVYWMLLGKNPDGTERVREYPDPNWTPPEPKPDLTDDEQSEKYSFMKWHEIAEEEEQYIQPTIKEQLEPLIKVPGYEYDDIQYEHLQNMAIKEGKDPSLVPQTGYFEFSRAYSHDVEANKVSNVLCSRQVPDWIPLRAFENVFQPFIRIEGGSNEEKEMSINMIESKDGSRTVFVSFNPSTRKAMFVLLMTRKVTIKHPTNPELECVLIFDHAYSDPRKKKNFAKKNNKSKSKSNSKSSSFEKPSRNKRDNIDISKYNYTTRN